MFYISVDLICMIRVFKESMLINMRVKLLIVTINTMIRVMNVDKLQIIHIMMENVVVL